MSQADRNSRSIPARPSDLIPAPAPPAPRRGRRLVVRAPGASARKLSVQAGLASLPTPLVAGPAALDGHGSSALMALAYHKVKPTYDAFSTIKVDPGDRGLFRENSSTVDFEVFKETQVKRVTNPNVINTALAAHPELLDLPEAGPSPRP